MVQHYVMQIVINWILSAFALVLAAKMMKGIKLRDTRSAFLSTFVLGILNATVFRLLWLLTLPVTILTLGLFLLVLNGAMLKLTARLVQGFRVDGWLAAIVGSVVLSIIQAALFFFYRRVFEG